MDEQTKRRLLKTCQLSLYAIDDPETVDSHVREAANLLGIHGSGIRSRSHGPRRTNSQPVLHPRRSTDAA